MDAAHSMEAVGASLSEVIRSVSLPSAYVIGSHCIPLCECFAVERK